MVKLQVIADQDEVSPLIRSAILAEIKRLELGLHKTQKAIRQFEEKYRISSEIFLRDYAAEDLDGGDAEYIEWAGELDIQQDILEDLRKLQAIEYVAQ
jgi:hypothetical protein